MSSLIQDFTAHKSSRFALMALLLLAVAYFTPIWWVSLTAPNYPPDAFPDGIRIHFHFDGVKNGCTKAIIKKSEVYQGDLGSENEATERYQKDQAQQLDCVHEMNTINHYVGMYPIASGGPVEKELSKYIMAFLGVMLLAFAANNRKRELQILGVGFTAVAVWMYGQMLGLGALDAYVKTYEEATATFFNEPEVITRWSANLRLAMHAVMGGMVAAMLIVLVGCWKWRKFSLLLAFVPALLPVFFILEYAGWLWFFGHNLHPWGAFTVKPFMPTVFGEGMVAQFSTFSYPDIGYALLLILSGLLLVATLLRRKQINQG